MTLSVDSTSPAHLNKESPLSMASTASPLISPCSDKRFWSALQNRVNALIEGQKSELPSSVSTLIDGEPIRAKRIKEDSALLMRGFDSIASSLSQLTNNLDNALQGARELAKPSTSMTDIVHCSTANAEKAEDKQEEESKNADGNGEMRRVKRKLDDTRCRSKDQEEGGEDASVKEKHQAENNLKKVKKLAVSMATKSASLAKELKSVKSDMCFLQERCALLEEENRRLRDGFGKGIRPDDDDLVRLQLEALLAEKSRLATDNANLTRENQCLRQLVEYHQFASQDLSASYEEAIQGLCLNFSSPTVEDGNNGIVNDLEDPQTPRAIGDFEPCCGELELLKD